MNGKIVFRIVSTLVLIAVIAVIGFMAYQAGLAQGSPVTIQAPEGQGIPAPYYYGHSMPFHPFGFGFGCFGILFTIFLMVLALKAFRFMVFGPRFAHHMGMHGYGPMGRGWGERGVPPMAEEWHRKMHEAMDSASKPEDKKE